VCVCVCVCALSLEGLNAVDWSGWSTERLTGVLHVKEEKKKKERKLGDCRWEYYVFLCCCDDDTSPVATPKK